MFFKLTELDRYSIANIGQNRMRINFDKAFDKPHHRPHHNNDSSHDVTNSTILFVLKTFQHFLFFQFYFDYYLTNKHKKIPKCAACRYLNHLALKKLGKICWEKSCNIFIALIDQIKYPACMKHETDDSIEAVQRAKDSQ